MSGVIAGSYGEHGDPCINFFLRGVAHPAPGIEYEGIVDTGFSGFVQVNILEACRLQLPLEGVTSVRLADGSTKATLTAIGLASLSEDPDETPVRGTVHLSPSTEVLIGMEFLRAFGKGLGIFKDSVFLLPDPPPGES